MSGAIPFAWDLTHGTDHALHKYLPEYGNDHHLLNRH